MFINLISIHLLKYDLKHKNKKKKKQPLYCIIHFLENDSQKKAHTLLQNSFLYIYYLMIRNSIVKGVNKRKSIRKHQIKKNNLNHMLNTTLSCCSYVIQSIILMILLMIQ